MASNASCERPTRAVSVVLAFLLVAIAGCSAAATSPTSAPTPAPVASTVAAPSATPIASPTAAADVLTGDWKTGVVTCAEMNAAITKAGFTKAQVTATDWDSTNCSNSAPPFTIRFKDGKLVEFQNLAVGWEGVYEIVDPQTFTAGDVANKYLTYHFTIDGDRLTIDVVADEFPDATHRLSDFVTQTAIYESAPFMRQP